ncbi:galactoside alpha-(1,2)-fucosyltransferase 2-like [Protopterus annectens]|uniref:galactoside alpha-(1,2)-fucosyltransferase 2-like n=1 Tax=Protopterus annectens TaxID=7888 RepID=UPI001CFAF57A|nr:galactoside alpha-(1,2)-fucosyltransferase 2-like [Protopterus annectens]XP_043915664.1 galactoside alpha-(1,2)-fucosyltransferase 2-like [Protopterus annectens]XP_043915666.1 galactoside alpha-(1,2)-fucosyltransferase 2-like [Protopterus annectens]
MAMNRIFKCFIIFLILACIAGISVFFKLSLRFNFSTIHFNIPSKICLPVNNNYESNRSNSVIKADNQLQNVKKYTGMWTVGTNGRLGNQMGAFSSLLGLANINGHQPYIEQHMYNYLAPYFQITVPLIHNEVANKIKWKHYWLHDWISPEHKKIEGEFVKFSGYPNSWTFYHHIRDEIRKQFTVHEFIREDVNSYLQKIKGMRKNVTYIGVHVRRGDYVHVMPNTWKGVVADRDYLEKAMKYFRDKYQEPVFVITSDGLDWCKSNLDNSRGDIYFPGDVTSSTPAVDLAMLIHCNHTIMTIGTFGFWAGYLTGGEVIYLDKYVLPNSPFLNVFKYEAFYLPEWIGIPANLSTLQKAE